MERIKCLVTDLDDTLWDGKIMGVGVDGIVPYEDRIKVLQQLDSRGILLSIASRNHQETVMEALDKFGIQDLFLVPQHCLPQFFLPPAFALLCLYSHQYPKYQFPNRSK